MAQPSLRQILDAPGTDTEREEAIRHFYPDEAKRFESAKVEEGPKPPTDLQTLQHFGGNPQGALTTLGDVGVGVLKGLGRMTAPLVKAVGLGNDYTDAALAPMGDVQDYAGSGAQLAATGLAMAAAPGLAMRAGIPAMAVKAATSPVGIGAMTTGGMMMAGRPFPEAAMEGVVAGAVGKIHLPGILGKLRTVLGGKASPAMSAEAIAEAEAILEHKQLQAVEEKVLRRELDQARKIAQMDASSAATARKAQAAADAEELAAARQIRKVDDIADRAEHARQVKMGEMDAKVKPIPPSKLKPDVPEPEIPAKAPKPDRGKQAKADFDARKAAKASEPAQAKPADLEEALQASVKSNVVHAPPAFPGQRSASNARFEAVAERLAADPVAAAMSEIDRVQSNVKKWVEGNTSSGVIRSRLNSIFKGKRSFSAEDVETLIDLAKKGN